jgi:hypothetical protein
MEYVLKREFELRQGDDYLDADNRSIKFIGAGVCWDTGITDAQLIIKPHRDTCNSTLVQALTINGDYTAPSSISAGFCKFDLTAAQTTTLTAGVRAYSYQVKGNTAIGNTVTLASGLVTVL